jgi:phosphatidylglycerophosphate synthase
VSLPVLTTAGRVYRETRKKHDQLFNVYVMRPIAAVFVAAVGETKITPNQLTLLNLAVFVVAAGMLIALPSYRGGLAAVAVLELSYCFDCADGMLARWKKLASKSGHLFDFFTDELKAVLLAGALAVRLWRMGGLGYDGATWGAGDARSLLGGLVAVTAIASAISLTNFVRSPEVSGRETSVEAYYETVEDKRPRSLFGRVAAHVTTFLRFLSHYPSHIWLWAAVGRMDAYLWLWTGLNLLYLARGWLGLVRRFGRRS